MLVVLQEHLQVLLFPVAVFNCVLHLLATSCLVERVLGSVACVACQTAPCKNLRVVSEIQCFIYKTYLFRESQRLCSFVHVNDVMHLNAPSVGPRELQLLEDVFAYADDYTSINAKEHMTELVVFMKEHIQHEIARMRILIEANKFFKDETLNFRDDSQVFAGGGLTRNAGNRS